MKNDDLLYAFSIGMIVVTGLMLIVPVLRRKSDVFTAWNFFLVGLMTFNGRSGINAATTQHYLSDLKSEDYLWYYVGTIVFFGSVCLTYYQFKMPRRLAGKTLLTWTDVNPVTAPLIATVLMSLLTFTVVSVPIPFIGQVLGQFSLAGPAFALAVVTVTWFRNRANPLLLVMVVGFAILAVAGAVGAGISRRYLISALSAVPVAMYWVWLRYKPTPVILTVIAAVVASVVPVVAGFTALRFSLKDEQASPIQRAQRLLTELPNAIRTGGSNEGFDGQDSVECALGVIHLLSSKEMEGEPFQTMLYVIANPIPRVFWPEKPESLGLALPDFFRLGNFEGSGFSLGLNVVGQCYYDGGLHIHILYGILMGIALRYFDDLMIRQPGNPLLIGALAASSAQLISWPRGCIGVVTMQLLLVVILLLIVRFLSRLILGTQVVYPRTDHLVPYPILRSEDDWKRWMQSVTSVVPRHMLQRSTDEAE